MNIYKGMRASNGSAAVTVNGKPLRLRLDLFNHSPTGFEWGYSGSGPAQLALAICANELNHDALAVRIHQHFKARVIASITANEWTMTGEEVRAICTTLAFRPGGSQLD